MDPIIGGALIGAGSSIISNLFSKGSNDSANKQNLKIAQMNNEWSERMMQKQMDYNTAQWQREMAYNDRVRAETDEYNSAVNQAKRLREAGINPALAMSGANAGTSQGGSAPSGNSIGLPSPSSATMQPYRYDFSGVGNAVMTAYQLEGQRKQMDANANYLETQSSWYGAKAMADIAQAFSNVRNTDLRSKAQSIQNNWLDAQLGADYINKIRQNQSLEVSMFNSIKQGVLLDKHIARFDERTNLEIADLIASIMLKYSQRQINKEQVKNLIETNKSLKLSNKEKEAIFDYVVDKADADRFKGYTPWSIGADVIHGIGKRLNKVFGW